MSTAAVILAAGLGKRMKSALPKVLHLAEGRPLIRWVADSARSAGANQLIAVVGPELTDSDKKNYLGGYDVVIQRERLGTGHAAIQAIPALKKEIDEVIVLCGDVPCIRPETIFSLLQSRREKNSAASVLTMLLDDPYGYGRIVRSKIDSSKIERIVEERDATEDERKIKEVNSGTYAFRRDILESGLKRLGRNNAQNEYYLTDVIRFCVTDGEDVVGSIADDSNELLGVNTPEQLKIVESVLAKRSERE